MCIVQGLRGLWVNRLDHDAPIYGSWLMIEWLKISRALGRLLGELRRQSRGRFRLCQSQQIWEYQIKRGMKWWGDHGIDNEDANDDDDDQLKSLNRQQNFFFNESKSMSRAAVNPFNVNYEMCLNESPN